MQRLALAAAVLTVACVASAVRAEDRPADLQPIGGRWFVCPGERPTYFYRDGDRYVDLFSYHMRDSNKDGIDEVQFTHDDHDLIVDSQGYPNHPTALFPNSGNPNSIRVQKFRFRLPLVPERSDHVTRLPMGPIGMALNGVVFFNPFEAGGMNAVEGYSEVWLDSCCGHPQQQGVYHYHKYPSCVKSPFADDGRQHSPVIGFAFDGYPVYGPYESDGILAKDLTGATALDVCNGHDDNERGYHYHVTAGKFPYVIGGYAGVPEISNNHLLARAREGAIVNNADGQSRLENVIATIRPGSAARGAKHTVRIELAPAKARRQPLPTETPTWVQIGPYEASHITRQGNVVTAEIDIPADASLGVLLDAHLEFTAANGAVQAFKKNDAFRIVE
ncbi:MAG: YHYH protein [Singulisphaera sp.]